MMAVDYDVVIVVRRSNWTLCCRCCNPGATVALVEPPPRRRGSKAQSVLGLAQQLVTLTAGIHSSPYRTQLRYICGVGRNNTSGLKVVSNRRQNSPAILAALG